MSENSIKSALNSEILEFRPHLFILDRLVRGYSRKEIEALPTESNVTFGSAHEAGLRIANKIRGIDAFAESPIILWSAFDSVESHSLPMTLCLNKDIGSVRFILAVRSVAAATSEPLPPKQKSKINSLASATELRPSFMGMSIDLKKLWTALTGG